MPTMHSFFVMVLLAADWFSATEAFLRTASPRQAFFRSLVTRAASSSRPPGLDIAQTLPLAAAPRAAAALLSRGINTATPIQDAAFSSVLRGDSLTLHSATGSGKTLALLLPLLLRLGLCTDVASNGADELAGRRVLVLAPSRELAAQLAAEAAALLGPGLAAGAVHLVCTGEKYVPTATSLGSCAVLVATPVELAEALWNDKTLREWLPHALGALVLDEVGSHFCKSSTRGPLAASRMWTHDLLL